jgi:autotransporter-associated beta strand protein
MVLKGGSNGITVNGAITGTAANSDLILDGGSITLASANTYNGPTYLLNGTTLTASVANALPTANGRTDVTMDATGSGSSTLALGASQSVASLTGAASSNVTLGSNTLTIGTTSGSTTFAGRISGSGNLVKDGASTQVLSGTNTFTGTTTINSGTLQAASANALGSTSSVVVNNGGSLLVTADDAIGTNTNITLNSTSTSAAGLAFSGNYNGTVGLLTLSKDSIIDLGLGSVVLRFSDIVGLAAHALKIYNWTGETLWGGTNRDNTDQIYVTADLNDPARAGELGNISFYSDFGNSFLGNGYQLTGSGFYNNQIIPVPESETWLGAAILLLAAAAYSLRRKNDPARNEPPA